LSAVCAIALCTFRRLNLSAAVNVLLAHRLMARQVAGKEPLLPLHEMLHEVRGEVFTPAMDALGWDGK
jgi:hypothetical protein